MTASEQLRALGGGGLIPNVTRVEIPAFLVPLIADVVEAAEFARSWARMPSDLRWEEFDAALAALDEALT